MAGHSKWANIQHRKNRQDAKKARAFTKVAREITVSARLGGGDPEANPRLRAAVAEARSINMPADNIQRAIDKGTGDLASDALEEFTYEGYGPGGVAMLVEGFTDNRNRTAAEIRNLFSKAGGSMAESGAVAWQFSRRSLITVPKDGRGEEEIAELVLEAGGEDYEEGEEAWVVLADAADLKSVSDALAERGVDVVSAEWIMDPAATLELEQGVARKAMDLLERLEDHDDVQKVWTNADLEG
jgi:YebC/PmpR family DNA-binding regulatory protein